MDEPLAVALKFGFLAVLYLFLLWVSRSALRDLTRGQEAAVASEPVDAPGGRHVRDDSEQGGMLDHMSPHLTVVAALGRQPGDVIDIAGGRHDGTRRFGGHQHRRSVRLVGARAHLCPR